MPDAGNRLAARLTREKEAPKKESLGDPNSHYPDAARDPAGEAPTPRMRGQRPPLPTAAEREEAHAHYWDLVAAGKVIPPGTDMQQVPDGGRSPFPRGIPWGVAPSDTSRKAVTSFDPRGSA